MWGDTAVVGAGIDQEKGDDIFVFNLGEAGFGVNFGFDDGDDDRIELEGFDEDTIGIVDAVTTVATLGGGTATGVTGAQIIGAGGLAEREDVSLLAPVEANLVFLDMPRAIFDGLGEDGFAIHAARGDPAGDQLRDDAGRCRPADRGGGASALIVEAAAPAGHLLGEPGRGAGPAPRADGDADPAPLGVVEIGDAFVEIG